MHYTAISHSILSAGAGRRDTVLLEISQAGLRLATILPFPANAETAPEFIVDIYGGRIVGYGV